MSKAKIKRALISVSDKTGLVDFAKSLAKQGVEIISTGGTLKTLQEAGIEAIPIDKVTEFPEMLDGRVKTLHPKIHGGLLFRRDLTSHVDQARKYGIKPIDLVCVNLYPFEKATSENNLSLDEAIEFIDIGGPSMLRSAAKNFKSVTVVTSPEDYKKVTNEMKENTGAVTDETRFDLAIKVFERTASYDAAILTYLKEKQAGDSAPVLPDQLNIRMNKVQDLRYGENPHQKAAYYQCASGKTSVRWKQLHGKELSFNNLLDMDATLDILDEFESPAACVVKHSNPCGVARGATILQALEDAIDCDAMSAFGGIVGLTDAVDKKTAERLLEKLPFFEILVAPHFEPAALAVLQTKKNLRLLKIEEMTEGYSLDAKFLRSGMLLQEKDKSLKSRMTEIKQNLKFVTKAKLNEQETEDLIFAFQCSKIVKSNAIVLTQGQRTVGIGAGQMSRVDSVQIACNKAHFFTDGAMLGSDAFFPMPDAIEFAAKKKIKAIIQPGGSIRDKDIIEACDKVGIVMAMVGERHFRH